MGASLAARLVVLAAVATLGVVVSAQAPAPPAEVVVVQGKLVHYRLTNDLFHIDKLWMRVEPGTQFHRWLSDADGHRVTVLVTPDPDRFGDDASVRILTGHLNHGTSPQAGSSVMHVLVLRDSVTDTLGPVTFQTEDPVTARAFDAFDDRTVSIVIRAN
jgi:hypothetical protein